MALMGEDDRLRHELGLLYSDVALEIRKRSGKGRRTPVAVPQIVRRARQTAPGLAVKGLVELAAGLKRLTGRDVVDLGRMLEIALFIQRQRELASRGSQAMIDDFGFDREWTESLLPIFRWLYHSYWRVVTTGIENVPGRGRTLLVANHAGVLPWDGAMIKTAILELHERPRHARALVAQFLFSLPTLSWFLRRTGQTVGDPDDSIRLLERDELVLVFPEGVKGTGKSWNERYRLQRFGRGGFVQVAIRTGSPIVPISVVGSEEIYPMLGNVEPLARMSGVPFFPVTPFFPLLGPLGMLPLPSRWRIQFHPAIRTDQLAPEQADDQNLVMTISDQVRDTIQQGLYDNLRLRRGTYR